MYFIFIVHVNSLYFHENKLKHIKAIKMNSTIYIPFKFPIINNRHSGKATSKFCPLSDDISTSFSLQSTCGLLLHAVKSLVNASNFPLKLSYIFSLSLFPLIQNTILAMPKINKFAIDRLHTQYSELLLSHSFAFYIVTIR